MTDDNKNTVSGEKPINLAVMSDDEIINLEPSILEEPQGKVATGTEEDITSEGSQDAAQSAGDAATDDNDAEGADGAAAADKSSDADVAGADTISDELSTDSGTEDQSTDAQQQTSASDQDADQGEADTGDTGKSPKEVDYKSEFEQLMAPFKAAKREIKLDNIDDARRLMQMGVDYSRKMADMKPYQRVLKTLEKNDLLDIEKINFLIDLDKGNPEAIKKFLKDSKIDPLDLSLEDDIDYKPNDHMVGDTELELDGVLDNIRGTEAFDRTVDVITNKWDTASKQILMDTPKIIGIINDHIAAGVFDQITAEVEKERMFGRLQGLSDLEAYKQVGDAIQKKNGFKHQSTNGTSAGSNTDQGSAQNSNGSQDLKDRKRAAKSTKAQASSGKPKIDLSKMTDEEIEKFDPATL